jgi:ornithine carbamoyltransferase
MTLLGERCGLDEYRPEPQVLAELEELRESTGRVEVLDDVLAAAEGVDFVYTDSWMSYRVPPEAKERRMRELDAFRVTPAVMARAAEGAAFLHCLPALRGMEVAAEVIDGPQSIVFEQAENRLHVEKAILLELLGGRWVTITR